jgi:hypothetical protein
MTSRLRFDLMPDELPEKAKRILDEAFRSIRSVLDVDQGGVRMREQFRTIDTVIDTARLPVPVKCATKPLGVLLVGATVQRTGTGEVISGGAVTWSWRGGGLLIHDVDGLAAATRYDATIAVME